VIGGGILNQENSRRCEHKKLLRDETTAMSITLSDANQAIRGALSRGRSLAARVSVSVCDPNGHLIAHQRMNGAGDSSWDSIGKAIAAVQEGRPSGERITEFARFPRSGLVTARGAPNLRRPGGLPIFRQGDLQGAIGVSGAPTDEEDDDCAHAGIAALESR
jgi:glc operon protein GlcG